MGDSFVCWEGFSTMRTNHRILRDFVIALSTDLRHHLPPESSIVFDLDLLDRIVVELIHVLLDSDDEFPIFCSQLPVSPALVLSNPPDCIRVPDSYHLCQSTVYLVVDASVGREDSELLIIKPVPKFWRLITSAFGE